MPVELSILQVNDHSRIHMVVPEFGGHVNLVDAPVAAILEPDGTLNRSVNDKIQHFNQRTLYRSRGGGSVRSEFVGESLGVIDKFLEDNPDIPDNQRQALHAIRRAIILPEQQASRQ